MIRLINSICPILRTCFGLIVVLLTVAAAAAQTQDTEEALLLKPEGALAATVPAQGEATLAPQVDGSALNFAGAQILIYKDRGPTEFVSAVWKDVSGQLSHQRDVLVVKPDYGVVIDYVYGKGRRAIVRSFAFPGQVALDQNGAQSALAVGKTFRVQAVDLAGLKVAPSAGSSGVVFSAAVTTPVPIPTVFLVWKGPAAPKVEPTKPANPMIVKFKVTFPDGRIDEIALAWEERPLHLSGKEFRGWAACLRHGPAGTSSIEIN